MRIVCCCLPGCCTSSGSRLLVRSLLLAPLAVPTSGPQRPTGRLSAPQRSAIWRSSRPAKNSQASPRSGSGGKSIDSSVTSLKVAGPITEGCSSTAYAGSRCISSPLAEACPPTPRPARAATFLLSSLTGPWPVLPSFLVRRARASMGRGRRGDGRSSVPSPTGSDALLFRRNSDEGDAIRGHDGDGRRPRTVHAGDGRAGGRDGDRPGRTPEGGGGRAKAKFPGPDGARRRRRSRTARPPSRWP